MKRSFRPDIIFIDYLNICASSRFKGNANVGSYFYIKAIAEELRGLAVETNVPIMSATQTTRTGYTSTDIGLEDTSESFGLMHFGLMFTHLDRGTRRPQSDCSQTVEERYNDPTMNKRFVLGIDRAKMRLYDCEQEAQEDLVDSGQDDNVFDNTLFGRAKDMRNSLTSRYKKEQVKYYTDINLENKKWEVIELPTKVVERYQFEEDAIVLVTI